MPAGQTELALGSPCCLRPDLFLCLLRGAPKWGCLGPGHHLPPSGSLVDIDECVTGVHNCSVNETCFNIQGSFRCLAFECPEHYRRSADT